MAWSLLNWLSMKPAPHAPAPDLYAQQAAFKMAVAQAEASLPPVVAENEAGELEMWPEGILMTRGKRQLAIALTRVRSSWSRSLN